MKGRRVIPWQWQVVTTRNTPQPPTTNMGYNNKQIPPWTHTWQENHKDNVDGVTSSNEQKEEHNHTKKKIELWQQPTTKPIPI
jgi:hypothetical protein